MAAYATATQLYARYGRTDVRKWADTGGLSESELDTRVDDALQDATDEIDNRLMGGPYAVPLVAVDGIIVRVCVQLTGADLYTRRGVTDFDDETNESRHRYSGEKAEAIDMLRSIRSGQVRLILAGDPIGIGYPQVVEIETSRDDED